MPEPDYRPQHFNKDCRSPSSRPTSPSKMSTRRHNKQQDMLALTKPHKENPGSCEPWSNLLIYHLNPCILSLKEFWPRLMWPVLRSARRMAAPSSSTPRSSRRSQPALNSPAWGPRHFPKWLFPLIGGLFFAGVLRIRALLFGIYIGAPDSGKLPKFTRKWVTTQRRALFRNTKKVWGFIEGSFRADLYKNHMAVFTKLGVLYRGVAGLLQIILRVSSQFRLYDGSLYRCSPFW